MTSKERAKHRAEANSIEPVFQIGKGGLSDAVIKQTEDAIKARELIKIKVLLDVSPEKPREIADKLAVAVGADVIQVIGGCIILYKENKEKREEEKAKEKKKKEEERKKRLKELAEKKSRAVYYKNKQYAKPEKGKSLKVKVRKK
ncbi:MAG: ribosome assembly RNA-binding protein YhbY [Clostridiales bacterium]|nr:ribosome assembly RNA-binding protein YhbY [Clostridiales bacterium]